DATLYNSVSSVFFFQAEDGIRDGHVTGVQTCALPICEYMPAPKANYVRVVINGESWGIYVNAQQFNKDFIRDWFNTKKGARWKRSEERRVGKEGRSRWGSKQWKEQVDGRRVTAICDR